LCAARASQALSQARARRTTHNMGTDSPRPHRHHRHGTARAWSPSNVVLLAFVSGLLILGLCTIGWHSSVLSSLPVEGIADGAGMDPRVAAAAAWKSRKVPPAQVAALPPVDSATRVLAAGAGSSKGALRVMLASHGRLQWYYPDTDTASVVHEGGVSGMHAFLGAWARWHHACSMRGRGARAARSDGI
jgi:hypothetical protein